MHAMTKDKYDLVVVVVVATIKLANILCFHTYGIPILIAMLQLLMGIPIDIPIILCFSYYSSATCGDPHP